MIAASASAAATAAAMTAGHDCGSTDPLAVYSTIYQEHAYVLGARATEPTEVQRRVLESCCIVHSQHHEPKDAVMLDLAMCDLLHVSLHREETDHGPAGDELSTEFLLGVFGWLVKRLDDHTHRCVVEAGRLGSTGDEKAAGANGSTSASVNDAGAPSGCAAEGDPELITFALELQQIAVKRLLSILLEVLDRLPLSTDEPEGPAVMEAMAPHLRPLLVSLIHDLKLTPQDHTHEMQLLAGQPCSPMDPWSYVLKCSEDVMSSIDLKDPRTGLVYRFAKMEWLQFHHEQNMMDGGGGGAQRRSRRKSFWSLATESYFGPMTVRRIASMCMDNLSVVLTATGGEHNELLKALLQAASQIEQPLLLEAAILAFGIIFGATEHDQVEHLGDILPNLVHWLVECVSHSSYLVRRIAAWALCNCATVLSEVQVQPQCALIPDTLSETLTEPISAADLVMMVLSSVALDQDYHVRTVALDALDGLLRLCGLHSEVIAGFVATQLYSSLLEASVMSPRVSMIPNQHIINMCRAVGSLALEAARNRLQCSNLQPGDGEDDNEGDLRGPDDHGDTLVTGLATLVTGLLRKAAHNDFELISCACECLAALCNHRHDVSRQCALEIAAALRGVLSSSAPLFLAEMAASGEDPMSIAGRDSFSRMPTFVSRDCLQFPTAVVLLVARLLRIPGAKAEVWSVLAAAEPGTRSSEDGEHEGGLHALASIAQFCVDSEADLFALKLLQESCGADPTCNEHEQLHALLGEIRPCTTRA